MFKQLMFQQQNAHTMLFFLRNCSQFGDIYQEEYFISVLKHEVNIVKELPPRLKSIDIEAIGSLVSYLLSFCAQFELTMHTPF